MEGLRVVRKIIDQYVDDVVRQLPVSRRRQAEKKLRGAIYEMLTEYTDGEKPVSRDARAVLRELGSPDEVADSYYRQKRKSGGKRGRIPAQTAWRIIRFMMILSAVFVTVGTLLIVIGVTSNTVLVFTGAALALLVMVVRMSMPVIEGVRLSFVRKAKKEKKK